MKVLVLCNSASGLNDFRGMLLKELISRGNTVRAVIPKTEEKTELIAEDGLKSIGCELIRVPMERRGTNPVRDIGLFRRYRRVIRGYQPDFAITYTVKPNIYGSLACHFAKIPCFANITGLGSSFQKDGLLKDFVTVLYKTALKKEKVVFFENTENCRIIVDHKIIRSGQAHVLAGAGVDLEKFTLCEYPQEQDETRFLFIGRVMQEKGIEQLLEAAEKLRDEGCRIHIGILGEYEENYSERLAECGDWLTYYGYQNDVRPFIEKAHCFVLPSWHEGMANTNLECAAMGRPVITSNIPGCREAVVDGVSGFLSEVRNADDLADKMRKFVSLSNEERRQMGLAGRKHMEDVFDKKAVVKETIDTMMGELS